MSSATAKDMKIEINLHIHLIAIALPKKIINNIEEIGVCITAIPEGNKQNFIIEKKKSHYIFSMHITNLTKQVNMAFREKNGNTDNPILAATTIILNDFSKFPSEGFISGIINTEIKIIDIYYPLQKQIEEEEKNKNKKNYKHLTRKVLGQMQMQLSYSSPNVSNQKMNSVKIQKNKKNEKIEKRVKFEEFERIQKERKLYLL